MTPLGDTSIKPQDASVAQRVRTKVQRSKSRFFRAGDFDGARTAVLRELSRLVNKGELHHVRRGLWWRGVQTPLGMTPPDNLALVRELVGDVGVGPASASAALALGLSTQHPARNILAVSTRPPSALPRTIELHDRSGRAGRVKQRLNWWEVALLEVLAAPRFVEADAEETVRTLANWLSSDHVRVDKLVKAAEGEAATVREGLRNVLARTGFAAEAQAVPPAASPLSARTRVLAVT